MRTTLIKSKIWTVKWKRVPKSKWISIALYGFPLGNELNPENSIYCIDLMESFLLLYTLCTLSYCAIPLMEFTWNPSKWNEKKKQPLYGKIQTEKVGNFLFMLFSHSLALFPLILHHLLWICSSLCTMTLSVRHQYCHGFSRIEISFWISFISASISKAPKIAKVPHFRALWSIKSARFFSLSLSLPSSSQSLSHFNLLLFFSFLAPFWLFSFICVLFVRVLPSHYHICICAIFDSREQLTSCLDWNIEYKETTESLTNKVSLMCK